jgi:hypothetical protein
MQYQIFKVNMPDPRAPSGSGEMVSGHFHIVTNNGHEIDSELVKLAGPGVIIVSLESQREFTHADMQAMAQKYRQEWNRKHIVTDLIPDYSTKAPFQD